MAGCRAGEGKAGLRSGCFSSPTAARGAAGSAAAAAATRPWRRPGTTRTVGSARARWTGSLPGLLRAKALCVCTCRSHPENCRAVITAGFGDRTVRHPFGSPGDLEGSGAWLSCCSMHCDRVGGCSGRPAAGHRRTACRGRPGVAQTGSCVGAGRRLRSGGEGAGGITCTNRNLRGVSAGLAFAVDRPTLPGFPLERSSMSRSMVWMQTHFFLLKKKLLCTSPLPVSQIRRWHSP